MDKLFEGAMDVKYFFSTHAQRLLITREDALVQRVGGIGETALERNLPHPWLDILMRRKSDSMQDAFWFQRQSKFRYKARFDGDR